MSPSPNMHLKLLVNASTYAMVCGASTTEVGTHSRTELDSHANMAVVGRYCCILEDTGQKADVNPFTPDYNALEKVPIVHAAVMYECPYSGKEHLLVLRDALYVKSMSNNLIPPFLLREAGVVVNDVPKIHVQDPTDKDHALYFPKREVTIPLQLWGVFSYFPTYKPTDLQLEDSESVLMLTPEWTWNPHTDAYSQSEEQMLDWEGNI